MNRISDWDERTICPNPNNVQNWESCLSFGSGPTKFGVHQSQLTADASSYCFNDTWMHEFVQHNKKPTEYRCLNQFTDELCSQDDIQNSRFFLVSKSRSLVNDYYVDLCMLRVNRHDITQQKQFCVNDIPMEYIEFLFMPVQWQMDALANNADYCGFHIWPYSYIEKNQQFRGFFDVIHFDITWWRLSPRILPLT